MAKRRGRGEGGLEQLRSGNWRAVISLGRCRETGKRLRDSETFSTKQKAIEWRARRMLELGVGAAASPELLHGRAVDGTLAGRHQEEASGGHLERLPAGQREARRAALGTRPALGPAQAGREQVDRGHGRGGRAAG